MGKEVESIFVETVEGKMVRIHSVKMFLNRKNIMTN